MNEGWGKSRVMEPFPSICSLSLLAAFVPFLSYSYLYFHFLKKKNLGHLSTPATYFPGKEPW